MKLLYIADAGAIHTQRWVKYFADKGHEVHLVSHRSFGDSNIENVELHLLQVYPLPIKLLVHTTFIKRLINRIKPDILHVHYIDINAFIAALTGFRPLVLSAWGSDVLTTPKNSMSITFMVKFALKRANVTTTTAEFMGDYLVNEFGLPKSKIIRIPWGIDLKIFHRGYEPETEKLRASLKIDKTSPVIISNRSMAPQYRIQSIVESIPSILHKHPDAIFVFLRGSGSDKFENEIKTRAEELGISASTRFVPRFLTPREMAIYLNMSDALISIPKSDQFAGCILEGMVCGAIPIVGQLEVYHQFLTDGENALFVDAKDPQKIAEGIIHSIEHPELRRKFHEINRKIVEEKEDWDKNAPKMEELYNELLSRKAIKVRAR